MASSYKFTLPAIARPGPYLLRAFVVSASVQAVAIANATFNVSSPDYHLELSSPKEIQLGDNVDLIATITVGSQVEVPGNVSVYLNGNFSAGDVSSTRGLQGPSRPFASVVLPAAGHPVDVSFAFKPTRLGLHVINFRVLSTGNAEVATGTLKVDVGTAVGPSVLGAFTMVDSGQDKNVLEVPANSSGRSFILSVEMPSRGSGHLTIRNL
jgi:hypothetical protein